jgi:hypothetical protein
MKYLYFNLRKIYSGISKESNTEAIFHNFKYISANSLRLAKEKIKEKI